MRSRCRTHLRLPEQDLHGDVTSKVFNTTYVRYPRIQIMGDETNRCSFCTRAEDFPRGGDFVFYWVFGSRPTGLGDTSSSRGPDR